MLTTHQSATRYFALGIVLIWVFSVTACLPSKDSVTEVQEYQPEILPLSKELSTYEAMVIPEDNPQTPEKDALGRQ